MRQMDRPRARGKQRERERERARRWEGKQTVRVVEYAEASGVAREENSVNPLPFGVC